MAQCPFCSTEISADFGLVDCPGCGAVLAVDLDGNVQAEAMESSSDPQSELVEAQSYEEPPALQEGQYDDYLQESDSEYFAESEESGSAENSMEPDFMMETSGTDEPQINNSEPEFASPNYYIGDAAGAEDEGDDEAVVPPPISSADLSDISSFANSEVSQGREGMLRYNLILAGIDTKEMREELHEVLNDQRYLWDADKLLAEINSGELRISDVPAVKAYLVIQNLRHLPIEISWEQYAIHQG